MSTWFKVACWICCGRGVVDGPLYPERCPNEQCPHRVQDCDKRRYGWFLLEAERLAGSNERGGS